MWAMQKFKNKEIHFLQVREFPGFFFVITIYTFKTQSLQHKLNVLVHPIFGVFALKLDLHSNPKNLILYLTCFKN